jgi:hypothetical protein
LILNPFRSSSKIDLLDKTEEKIRRGLEINITSYVFEPETGPSLSGCISIDKYGEGNVRVKSVSGRDIGARIEGNKVNIDYDGDFYKIYIAENLLPIGESGLENCDTMVVGAYGVPLTRKVFPVERIRELEDGVYVSFRNTLDISNDFKLTIIRDGGNIVIGKEAPQGANIQARELVIEILNDDATIEYGRMNLLVW